MGILTDTLARVRQETEREVSDDLEGKEAELHKELKLVIEHGCSPQEAGRRLGIACANLSLWVRLHRDEQQQDESGMARRDLEEENCSLKKENQRFRMEREIWGGENPYDLAQKFNPVFIPMMF